MQLNASLARNAGEKSILVLRNAQRRDKYPCTQYIDENNCTFQLSELNRDADDSKSADVFSQNQQAYSDSD